MNSSYLTPTLCERKCNFENHETQFIIGICLNESCQDPCPLFCQQCVEAGKHKSCNNQLKIQDKLIDLNKFLERTLEQYITGLEENFQNLLEKINKVKKLCQTFIKECSQLFDFKGDQEIKQMIPQIRLVQKLKINYESLEKIQQNQTEFKKLLLQGIQGSIQQDSIQNTVRSGVYLLTQGDMNQTTNKFDVIIKNLEKQLSIAQFFQSIALKERDEIGQGFLLKEKACFLNPEISKDIMDNIAQVIDSQQVNNVWVQIVKIYALELANSNDNALKLCDEVLGQNDSSSPNLLQKIDKCDDALKHIEQVLKENSNCYLAKLYKGNALRSIKSYNEAIQQYEECLKIDSKNCQALNNKGATLLNLKKKQEALETFKQALFAYHNYPTLLFNFGGALLNSNEKNAAQFFQELAIKLNPSLKKA